VPESPETPKNTPGQLDGHAVHVAAQRRATVDDLAAKEVHGDQQPVLVRSPSHRRYPPE
jgi:hypothetical protein